VDQRGRRRLGHARQLEHGDGARGSRRRRHSPPGITVTHAAGNSDTVNSLTIGNNLGDTLALSAGTLSLTSTSSLNNNALNVSGGTLSGAGSLSVGGLFNWTGGTLGGTGSLTANGGISMNGDINLDTRTLTNAATATWTGTRPFIVNHGAVFNNLAGATVDLQDDARIQYQVGAAPTFNNAGLFKKSAGTYSEIPSVFNNSGTVSVLSGALVLIGPAASVSTSSGAFTGAASTFLQFLGPHNLTAASSISANFVIFGGTTTIAGSYSVSTETEVDSPGVVTFTGTVSSVGALAISGSATFSPAAGGPVTLTVPSLSVSSSGATLTGTDSFIVSGLFSWTWGTLSGTGSLTANGGISMSGDINLDTRTLTNAATATWTGTRPFIVNHGAVFNNLAGATVDAQSDAAFNWQGIGAMPTFNNAGLVQKSAGAGTTSIGANFNNSGTVNAQSGTLQVSNYQQTAGSTILSGGSLASGNPILINGGTLTGSGFIYANVTNAGQVNPGSPLGLLNIQGNYTQTAPGDLRILLGGLTPVTQYNQLEVANSIALGGTLHVALVTGYMPHVNDTFTILKNDSGGAVAGTFAGLAEGAAFIAGGYQFRISYVGGAGHDVTLTVIKSPTATSVNSSANASVYGQAVTLTATVNPPTGASTPSGTITFTIDGTPQAPVTLSGGQASFTVTAFAAGSHTITAAYSGDNLFIVSNSPAFAQTVNQAPLSISADNKTKVYGASLPALTASYSGFVNGDTAASLTTAPTLTTPATAASHVGSYAITASGAVNANYTISYTAGTLSVTPASLTITADSKPKVYGAALPALTASYSGFVSGDISASLTTQPTLTTTATAGSHVSGSPYSISASGGWTATTPSATPPAL
jgi:hypothetical protein